MTTYSTCCHFRLRPDSFWIWHLEDVASSDLVLVHELVHLGQILQFDRLEWRMDQASYKEIDGLFAVLSVSDVAGLNADHLQHRFKNGGLDLGTSRQADDDDSAAWPDIFCRLCKWFRSHSNEDDGVGSEAVLGSRTNILNDVGRFGKVDERLNRCESAKNERHVEGPKGSNVP
jgi:hypothetical protein